MTGIIMNPTSDAAVEQQQQAQAQHAQRVKEVQALFQECLVRYKKQRDETPPGKPRRTDEQIVEMALRTLIVNGYNRAEVMDAMAQVVPQEQPR